MSNLQSRVVTKTAYLTLHYRLGSAEENNIVSTFAGNPATLELGTGQLAPFLEECLLGLAEGAHQTFELPPESAFGPRNPGLLQRVALATLRENSSKDPQPEIGDMVHLAAPGGCRFTGVLREIDGADAVLDFNHPLAGRALQFEVSIIGIL